MTMTSSTKAAFTPGPYHLIRTADGVDDYWEIKAKSNNAHVGSVWFWDDRAEDTERALANATLFMMSTELLAITKSLVRANRKMPVSHRTASFTKLQRQAMKIVAMAEGRE